MNHKSSRPLAQQPISYNREWRWQKNEPCALCGQPFHWHKARTKRRRQITDHKFTARLSQAWPVDEHGCLILPAEKRNGQYVTLPCPHCGRRHYHGAPTDNVTLHRCQHCLPQEAADLLIGDTLYPARTGNYVLAPLATRA